MTGVFDAGFSGCWFRVGWVWICGFFFFFGFGLGGFWLDCLVLWFWTHSREGRWVLVFTTVFSSCLGILVGVVALAAASAAAAALAAAQISWGRYMKVILVMLWVGFVDLCVACPTICWNFFFFSDRALL